MANRSANVVAWVEPDIKRKVEAILSELGISVSSIINILYRQIILSNGVPFDIKLPNKLQTLDKMSEEEFNEIINISLEQSEKGLTIPFDEAMDEITKKIK